MHEACVARGALASQGQRSVEAADAANSSSSSAGAADSGDIVSVAKETQESRKQRIRAALVQGKGDRRGMTRRGKAVVPAWTNFIFSFL